MEDGLNEYLECTCGVAMTANANVAIVRKNTHM